MRDWIDTTLPPENVGHSIDAAGPMIDRARDAHHAGVNLVVEAMSALPDFASKPVFNKHGAFVIHHWEASSRSALSLILALYGSYHAGYTLLRSLLETVLQGAALDYIALHLRGVVPTLAVEFRKTSGIGDLFEGNRPAVYAGRCERDSFEFLKILGATGLTFAPSFQSLCRQLEVWGLLYPIEDIREYAQYAELSSNVHGQHRRSNLVRASATTKEVVFTQRTPVVPPALLHYMDAHARVADACGVVELNLIKEDVKASPPMMAHLREIPDRKSFVAAQLPHLTQLVKDLGVH